MKASGEFIPSSPHRERCATEGHSFCYPKEEVVKEASPKTGEAEETMEITSSEGALKTEDVTDTQDFGERDETMTTNDFIVLRYVKMIYVCEVLFLYWELLNWERPQVRLFR